MKKSMLLVITLVIFLMTTFTYAVNEKKGSVKERSNAMVTKLAVDIALSDSQRVAVEAAAETYFTNRDSAENQSSTLGEIIRKKDAYAVYKTSLDSILTEEQKAQIQEKNNERSVSQANHYSKSR